jgi:short-subunit dehydrogenase
VGFFSDVPLGRWMANYHCNATCAIPISHHFLNKMMAANRPGLLAYTSSSACLFPNPFSSLYASTKAFLTMFACSVAAEVRSLGIDVVVVHPSPMATNFFKAGEGLAMLMAFKKLAAGPEVIADVLFSSAGRFVVRDQGAVTIFFRFVLKVIDSVFFAELTSWFAHTTGDYKQFTAQRLKAKAN